MPKLAPMLVVLLLTRSATAQQWQAPPPQQLPYPQQFPYPPQPMPQANGSATTQQLNDAEREDSGRGLEFFYASAGIGGSYLGLSASPRSTALGLTKVSGPGLTADVGLGVRFVTLTVGPRARGSPRSPVSPCGKSISKRRRTSRTGRSTATSASTGDTRFQGKSATIRWS